MKDAVDKRGPLLDEVLRGEDPIAEAVSLGEVAAQVGFDWERAVDVLEKVREEADELAEVFACDPVDTARARDELGDLLFAACMVARKAGVDPAAALRQTNEKFRRRFHVIERELGRRGISPESASLEQMEAIWQASKRGEPA